MIADKEFRRKFFRDYSNRIFLRNQAAVTTAPIARKNIEEHGGRIEVQSKQGEGTTVTVLLPQSKVQDSVPLRLGS